MDLSLEEQAAASAVAALGDMGKRQREDSPDAAGGFKPGKIARMDEGDAAIVDVAMGQEPAEQAQNVAPAELKPYPFFYYKDFSTQADPDPLTPLTPPGRVPNFPAKMHSILSRPDLADIICWMPHGRSWRVLKPREFEVKVIPTYFEHAKFSSFIRQANGWGFRRITQGRDRNSYYHELFLRGLPHLCKQMKRPGVAEKQAADPEHEPDFYKISEIHPVPEKSDDDSILLQCTLQGGPKARMPIYSGALSSAAKIDFKVTSDLKVPALPSATLPQLTPHDQEALKAFQQSLGASENQMKNLSFNSAPAQPQQQPVAIPQSTFAAQAQAPTPMALGPNKISPLALANQLAFANPNMAAAFQATTAASQFAAGFAAAAALSQQQFRHMLGSLAAGMQQTQAPQQTPPSQPPFQPN